MNLTATLRVALRALVRNKVRSLLTTLGIIVGIAAVIAMMAVGKGASMMIEEQIASMGSNLLMVFPGTSMMGGMRSGTGGVRTLNVDDGEAILRECPYVETLTPLVRAGAQIVYQDQNWSTSIQGVSPNYLEVRNWDLGEGEFFGDSEVRTAARVAVLGQTVVKNLFEGDDPVGKTIRIKNMLFRVIGVLQPKGSTAWGMDQDDTIIIPWLTVRRVIQNSAFNDVNQLLLKLKSKNVTEAAIDDISALLRQRHHLAKGADDDFSVMDMTEIADTISKVTKVMTVLLTVIASISLMVGGIGIMNIMLVSVTERTREIGLRMAVGARRKDILLQFLVEAVVLAGIGGLLGTGLGAGAAQILSSTNHWPILISPAYVLLALIFSGAVGIFFGFYPAWRASKLDPIEALRYE
jgi:putative ABC transport system permease protein